MLATIRDRRGQGNAALYVRTRDVVGRYWNLVTSAWDAVETAQARTFLVEYQDADAVEARYQASIAPPSGDVVVEYVRAADAAVIGEEAPPATPTLAAIKAKTDALPATPAAQGDISSLQTLLVDKLNRVLGLVLENAVQDQQVYDVDGRLTSGRIRCYDSPTNAIAAGATGLLKTYTVSAGYDTLGNLNFFRIAG